MSESLLPASQSSVSNNTIDNAADDDDDADTPVMELEEPSSLFSNAPESSSRPYDRPFTSPEPSLNQGTVPEPSPRELLRQKMQMLRAARTRGTGVQSTKSQRKQKETKKMANQYMQDPDEMLRSLGIQNDTVREQIKQAMENGNINDIKKMAATIAQSVEPQEQQ